MNNPFKLNSTAIFEHQITYILIKRCAVCTAYMHSKRFLKESLRNAFFSDFKCTSSVFVKGYFTSGYTKFNAFRYNNFLF